MNLRPENDKLISLLKLKILRIEFRKDGRSKRFPEERVILELAAFAVFNISVLYADLALSIGDTVITVRAVRLDIVSEKPVHLMTSQVCI